MPFTRLIAVLALCSAFALSACGNPPQKDQSAKGANATPEQSLQEIDVVRKDLIRVGHQVQLGHRNVAVDIASETYVQHFEKVEKPLGKVDEGLKERLEKGLSGTLRQQIKAGAAYRQVAKLITKLDNDLGLAQEKLKQ
jgi:hypothetical protein